MAPGTSVTRDTRNLTTPASMLFSRHSNSGVAHFRWSVRDVE
jgi:hypothetical protein